MTKGESGSLDRVLVDGDVHLVQTMLQLLAGDTGFPQIHQHQMVIRAAGYQLEAAVQQAGGQRLGVFADLILIALEGGRQRLAEADRLGRDDMHQRPALGAGEHRFVDGLGQLFPAEDHAAPGAAQGLMGGGGHHVGIGHGIHMTAGGHQTRDMGHIHHQLRAAGIGDLP